MDLKAPDVAVDPSRSRYSSFIPKGGSSGFDAILTGYEHTLATYCLERPTFPTFAVELVTGGMGEVWLNGRKRSLQRGSIFTYGPKVQHRIESDSQHPLRKYFIDLVNLPPRRGLPIPAAGVCTTTSSVDRLAALLEGILQDDPEDIDSPAIRRHSLALIIHIISASTRLESAPKSAAYQTYLKARHHMESNYHQPGSVEDFARSLHIDNTYLTRLFKRFSAETPYQFLTRLRMARASQLLLRHTLQIQQISEAVGYSDPFHFSTLFRRHHGSSPKEFRSLRKR